jgi:antitoxin component of RelBE/YafQ-DinJ toxin-antitoxin module
MKKTEILKFRVDAQTREALQHYCKVTGLSPSQVVRTMVDDFTRKEAPPGEVPLKSLPAHDQSATTGAHIIATLLLTQQYRKGDRRLEKMPHFHEVARLVDELLHILWGDDHAPSPGGGVSHKGFLGQHSKCASG